MMGPPKRWEQEGVGNGIMSKYYTRHNKLEYWSNPHESPRSTHRNRDSHRQREYE